MRRIKKLKTLVYALMGTTLISACSSDADDVISEAGKGYVSLSVQADAGFQTTRAASEDYEDVNNYTVQILQNDKVVDTCERQYAPGRRLFRENPCNEPAVMLSYYK